MMQRGRKSAASREVGPVPLNPRPSPPADLSEAEAAVWGDLVSSMRPDYFTRSDHPVLAAACRHIVGGGTISTWLRDTAGAADADLGEIERLLKMRQRETASALSCLRALRLTKQAQDHQRTAARAVSSGAPPPWELWEDADR